MNNILKFVLIFLGTSAALHGSYYYFTKDGDTNRSIISNTNDTNMRNRRDIDFSDDMSDFYTTKDTAPPPCPAMPEHLGLITQYIDMGNSSHLPDGMQYTIVSGGWSRPCCCKAPQPVAIIIPYVSRDNEMFLSAFLFYIHPILAKQLLDYRIFVVQSSHDSPYMDLPGKLLNIGIRQARLFRPDWACFIFHHPQMLPLNSKNLYRCGTTPRLLATSFVLSHVRYGADHWILIKGPVRDINAVGGVLAMSYDQVVKVKGFTNKIIDMDDVFSNMIDRINITFDKLESNTSSIYEYAFFKPTTHRLYRRYYSKYAGWTRTPWDDADDGLMSPSLKDDVVSLDVKENFLYTSIQVNFKKP